MRCAAPKAAIYSPCRLLANGERAVENPARDGRPSYTFRLYSFSPLIIPTRQSYQKRKKVKKKERRRKKDIIARTTSLNSILRPVDSVGSAIELDKMIPRPVVQTVLFIGPGADPVRNGLDVVPDLLVAYILDVRDLRVLDAELVAVVGTDDGHAVAVDGDHVLDGGIALGLVQAVPAALVESACTVELDIGSSRAVGESGRTNRKCRRRIR